MIIATANLELKLDTPEQLLAKVKALPPEQLAEVSSKWLETVRTTQPGDVWRLGFSIYERASGQDVGSCGFKGPPDEQGMVEIAYGIEPAHQRRGYATEAARALAEYAFASGVQQVCAHTKSDNPASARVLTKASFQCVGEVVDPEDGLVLRWVRLKDLHAACGE